MSATPPPPMGENWKPWAERLNSFMTTTRNKLQFYSSTSKATQNGAWVKLKYDP